MYDVVIVGARCAGSALALMLAREGLKVLVIDRANFPSDTMSGHFIQPAGVSCLRRLGLFEAWKPLAHRRNTTMTVDFGPVVLSGQPDAGPDGTSAAYAPRRYLFDPMLARRGGRGRRRAARRRQLRRAADRRRPRGRHRGSAADSGHLEASGSARRRRRRQALARCARGRRAGLRHAPAAAACYYALLERLRHARQHPAVRPRRPVRRRRADQ